MTSDENTAGSAHASTRSSAKAKARSAARTTKLVIGGVVIVLLTLLVVANTDSVKVHLLAGDVTLPLIVLLVIVAAAGALIGSLLTLAMRRSSR